jgi:hypothetical protein
MAFLGAETSGRGEGYHILSRFVPQAPETIDRRGEL